MDLSEGMMSYKASDGTRQWDGSKNVVTINAIVTDATENTQLIENDIVKMMEHIRKTNILRA